MILSVLMGLWVGTVYILRQKLCFVRRIKFILKYFRIEYSDLFLSYCREHKRELKDLYSTVQRAGLGNIGDVKQQNSYILCSSETKLQFAESSKILSCRTGHRIQAKLCSLCILFGTEMIVLCSRSIWLGVCNNVC